MPGVIILVPAYNEQETIATTICDLRQHGAYDICVINDASTDNTKQIVEDSDIILLNSSSNVGYSRSICKGLKYALSEGYSVAVTFDADNQFYACDIPRLLQRLTQNTAMVVGTRPYKQRVSEYLIGAITFILHQIPDPFCGLKVFNLSILSHFIESADDSLVNTLHLSKALKNNLTVSVVPVSQRPRLNSSSRFGSGLKADFKLFIDFFRWYC